MLGRTTIRGLKPGGYERWRKSMVTLRRAFTLVAVLIVSCLCWAATSRSDQDTTNLFQNGDFRKHDAKGKAEGFEVEGSALLCYPGDPRAEVTDYGAALNSSGRSGSVWQIVNGVDISKGKWYRFSFRGLPLSNFAVNENDLYMKVEFFGEGGTPSYDGKRKTIYEQIEQARKDLTVNGIRHNDGAAVWQNYQLDFCLPFPQVHQLKVSVGFGHGAATRTVHCNFYVSDFNLIHIPDPPDATPANEKPTPAIVPAYAKLIPIGGRWFYAAGEGESKAPAQFDDSNANRLLYKDSGYSAPFAGNTTAWLHRNNIDAEGNTIDADKFVRDNLAISFDATSMILRSHGLPNHPTGVFPSQGFGGDFQGNPNSIVERIRTYYIPLNPKENPQHAATAADNSNHALPMGPIGIAINGVAFFNPFDANSTDATDLMDRCCGHPAPDGQYHYHKYPICVNSPWADEGKEHSPLIGFAFDGYPVYGPYESKDVMAKDATGEHALNEFNMHYDAERGWHYHVTPGKFPYIIGGCWGIEDSRDAQRGGRGGGMRAGGGFGGPPGGGIGPPPNGR
jgi:hypothetical protein